MDWLTITTTLVAAIAPSVISIVSLCLQQKTTKENNELQLKISNLNNEHQLKLKDLDFIQSQRTNAINSYLDSLVQCIYNPTQDNLMLYQSAMAKVALYVSPEVYEEVDSINTHIQSENYSGIQKFFFTRLVDAINADAEKRN